MKRITRKYRHVPQDCIHVEQDGLTLLMLVLSHKGIMIEWQEDGYTKQIDPVELKEFVRRLKKSFKVNWYK